jgi:hypothetical protein
VPLQGYNLQGAFTKEVCKSIVRKFEKNSYQAGTNVDCDLGLAFAYAGLSDNKNDPSKDSASKYFAAAWPALKNLPKGGYTNYELIVAKAIQLLQYQDHYDLCAEACHQLNNDPDWYTKDVPLEAYALACANKISEAKKLLDNFDTPTDELKGKKLKVEADIYFLKGDYSKAWKTYEKSSTQYNAHAAGVSWIFQLVSGAKTGNGTYKTPFNMADLDSRVPFRVLLVVKEYFK